MRTDYLLNASLVIDDPYILVNVVSRRVKQLRRGHRPLIESLEKLLPEDIALREIAERKITYTIATSEELEADKPTLRTRSSAARNGPLRSHSEIVSARAS
jgi:DNA-directed RNA polymerase subunit omega